MSDSQEVEAVVVLCSARGPHRFAVCVCVSGACVWFSLCVFMCVCVCVCVCVWMFSMNERAHGHACRECLAAHLRYTRCMCTYINPYNAAACMCTNDLQVLSINDDDGATAAAAVDLVMRLSVRELQSPTLCAVVVFLGRHKYHSSNNVEAPTS